MKFRTFTAAVVGLGLAGAAGAQVAATPEFTPEAFRAHVAFLADDLLEGRDAGTRGYDIAARYVASQFEELGLQPAGADGSWYQQVPFVQYKLADQPGGVTIGGRRFAHGDNVAVSASPLAGPARIEAPAVFVGYGLDAPAQGFDDYAGLDVKGKVVVMLPGAPKGTASDIAAHLNSDKRRMASARGAAGVITLFTPEGAARYPWEVLVRRAGERGMTWVAPDGTPFTTAPGIGHSATINATAAEALFAGAPRSFKAVLDEAAREGGKPRGFALAPQVAIERQVATSRLTSPNVVAMLPGSDPKLAGEYVLMMAHLDHEGTNPALEGDKIFNGAMDNATGVATLIETARAMAQSGKRPRRPILFAAVTAEEDGLLGSQYLAKNPVAKNGRVMSVVNLDMPVLTYDFTDVIAFGAEHSTLGPIVERAGAKMNVKLIDDPLPQEGLFTRSDHYRFVQEGIPAVFLMTGFGNGGQEKFTHFLRTDYHKVSDEVDLPFDWKAGAKFARINYLIAREIADADQAPRWYANSFFGNVFAPNQPKAKAAGK